MTLFSFGVSVCHTVHPEPTLPDLFTSSKRPGGAVPYASPRAKHMDLSVRRVDTVLPSAIR